ncbi:uncharacterized protein [Aquarana catesbeiana]|uniref:uncharacterized protein isoform X2 n=1 Tax=Aquarana catesbeiana TaxID=8400 RepID=UPI003CC9F771
MEKECGLTERVLKLTLEIICLLTGENYLAFKLSDGLFTSSLLNPQSPIIEPSSHFLRKNKKRIEEVIRETIELLTGEVPIRCQDVTVYFSMEEWEYIEEHRDSMMENWLPLPSLDGSSNGNPPERCPRPLYSWDSTQEHQQIPQEDQVMLNADQTDCVTEDTASPQTEVKDEEDVEVIQIKIEEQEVLPEISKDGAMEEEEDITSDSSEHSITPDLNSVLPSANCSSNPSPQIGNLLGLSPPATDHTACRVGKRFLCTMCGKSFTRRASVIQHQKKHTGEKPYSCSECGKCFDRKRNLMTHHRIHSGEKPFSCSECGRLFAWRASLVEHQRTHTGEKPYPCLECGKCFTQKTHLTKHQRTHTGEKPYSCSECGKRFTEKAYVIVHERTHTGVKPYSCTECGKCFNQRSHFFAHQRSHTGEKPFSCAECRECFSERAQLATHQIIHTDVHPYSCPVCGKCYSSKSNLVRHQQVHTNMETPACSD